MGKAYVANRPHTWVKHQRQFSTLWPSLTREYHMQDYSAWLQRNHGGPGWLVVWRGQELATCETREVARALLRDKKLENTRPTGATSEETT